MALTVPEEAREVLRRQIKRGLTRELYGRKLITEEEFHRLMEGGRCR